MSNPEIPSDSMPRQWIKPIWKLGSPIASPEIYDSCGLGLNDGQKGFAPVPESVSVFKIISEKNYVGFVEIFDKDSVLQRKFTLEFGFCGELTNANRQVSGGYPSFVGWDGRNTNGVLLKDTVFVWRIILRFGNGTEKVDVVSIETR